MDDAEFFQGSLERFGWIIFIDILLTFGNCFCLFIRLFLRSKEAKDTISSKYSIWTDTPDLFSFWVAVRGYVDTNFII